MRRYFFVVLFLCITSLCCTSAMGAAPTITSIAGYGITPYTLAPAGESMVSYDWTSQGDLYYMCGDPNWGLLLKVYRHTGAGDTAVYTNNTVFAGSRLTALGDYIYFNDGGDFARYTFNYFAYDPVSANTPTVILDSTASGSPSLWGMEIRNHETVFASGAVGFGATSLYYTVPTPQNALNTWTALGEIGESSGPIAFDDAGNLYYAHGYVYSGQAQVFRWTAQEVTAAMSHPSETPLSPTGHGIATLPAAFTGASGMAIDAAGHLFITANAFGVAGQLLLFSPDTQGNYTEGIVLAEGAGRLDTLRIRADKLYVNNPEGIYSTSLPLTVKAASGVTTIAAVAGKHTTLAVETQYGEGDLSYQWHKIDGGKSDSIVGDDSPILAITPKQSDDGAMYYCTVSDIALSVNSPSMTLQVAPAVPAAEGFAIIIMLGAVIGMACYTLRQRFT